MRETWYVLEDGSPANPREVATDDKGVLRHKNGMAVAIGPHGPRSRGVDVDTIVQPQPESREMKPAKPRRGYRTRAVVADEPAAEPAPEAVAETQPEPEIADAEVADESTAD